MKLKQICIFFLAYFAFCSTSQGQDKSVYNPELLDLGEGKVISSALNVSGDYVIQEFKVEVKKAGKYYLAAWVNGAMDLNGEMLKYSVLLNDEKNEFVIRAEKSHPHAIFITLLLEEDETYTFETSNTTNGTDPVIHLFDKYSQHPDYSWTDDNNGTGNNAKLTVDIGLYAGYYYLFIRKARTSDGTCDLTVTEGNSPVFSASNCAVSGSRIQCNKTSSYTLNWFTADLTGDSHIWLEDQTGTPGEIIAYNNNWTASSPFTWGNNSRIQKTSTNVRALIVSSHSSSNPIGNCDLYMNVQDFNAVYGTDCMVSGNQSDHYVCYSWAGGRTDYPLPEDEVFDPWTDGAPTAIKKLDNFYRNVTTAGVSLPRYAGAPTYIRDATLDTINAVILLM